MRGYWVIVGKDYKNRLIYWKTHNTWDLDISYAHQCVTQTEAENIAANMQRNPKYKDVYVEMKVEK